MVLSGAMGKIDAGGIVDAAKSVMAGRIVDVHVHVWLPSAVSHTRQAVTLSPNNSTHCKILSHALSSSESTPQRQFLLTVFSARLRKLPPPSPIRSRRLVLARVGE
jgi:hypothetical protein